jgi:poly-gamma-glutamate synthesis protein (capsule biosynthesis protein)
MVKAVATAHAQADIVIVSLHWGYEYELRPDPAQQRLAASMRAAGADIIAGHHPHVVQTVTLLDGGVVAYSLGNFLFDQGNGETGQGLILRVLLDQQGVRAVQGLPIRAGVRPSLIAPAEADELLARISPPPQRVGYAVDGGRLRRVAVSAELATGRFWSGEVDLTGDGQAERIRLEGTRARIYQGGRLSWESPAGWEVVDVALGDPNDDGRQELMLAVWKDDPAGFRRSHPYLIGYRGGAYSLIWGGRAVAEPIREIELGDVDGDGRQELLVLLEEASGRRVVAVWRWHGWGFSLISRSSPGAYRDLVLPSGLGDTLPVISVALSPE